MSLRYRFIQLLSCVPRRLFFTANDSQAISRSRDKLRCLQILAREGIGLPVTGIAHATQDIDGLIETVGGTPLVIKLLE